MEGGRISATLGITSLWGEGRESGLNGQMIPGSNPVKGFPVDRDVSDFSLSPCKAVVSLSGWMDLVG